MGTCSASGSGRAEAVALSKHLNVRSIMSRFAVATLGLTLAAIGCDQKGASKPAPITRASSSTSVSTTGAKRPGATAAKPPQAIVRPASSAGVGASKVTWLKVGLGYQPVAILELRGSATPKLTVVTPGSEADRLKKTLPELASAKGIAIDFHDVTPAGKRGDLMTKLVKPGDDDYSEALTSRLKDKKFDVDQVLPLEQPSPSSPIKKLSFVRSGKPFGSIDFSGKKPTVVYAKDRTSDVMGLESTWRYLQQHPKLHVSYVETTARGPRLVSKTAAPGDPNYGDVLRIWLFAEKDYKKRYGYEVTVE